MINVVSEDVVFKQAPREPDDGAVSVRRVTDASGRERLLLVCGESVIECSFYNASRLFGIMAMMLGIPLAEAVGKEIKLGDVPV